MEKKTEKLKKSGSESKSINIENYLAARRHLMQCYWICLYLYKTLYVWDNWTLQTQNFFPLY